MKYNSRYRVRVMGFPQIQIPLALFGYPDMRVVLFDACMYFLFTFRRYASQSSYGETPLLL